MVDAAKLIDAARPFVLADMRLFITFTAGQRLLCGIHGYKDPIRKLYVDINRTGIDDLSAAIAKAVADG